MGYKVLEHLFVPFVFFLKSIKQEREGHRVPTLPQKGVCRKAALWKGLVLLFAR